MTGVPCPDLDDLQTLEIILTSRCNLCCSYCYQNARTARSMEWETLRASLDLILRSRREKVALLFIRGEPLLEFRLLRRAVEYVEDVRRREMSVHYEISTNGTLLRDEHLDFFAAHEIGVQLSFDGVPLAQDLRGKGTSAVLDRLLDRLGEKHGGFFRHRLRINLTLLARTIPWLFESVAYFLGKGVQTIVISPDITDQPQWELNRIDELDRAFECVYRLCLDHLQRTLR